MKKMKLDIQRFSALHTYINFEDYPSTNTPLSASNLNALQDYIYQDIRESGGGSGETLKVGTILQYSGATVPTGYMFCDGTAISRTEYATLFSVIGTTYGAGDGSTTFNLPNFNGKVAVGLDSNDSDFDTLGETGGEKTHTLTTTEIPSHKHEGLYWLGDANRPMSLNSGSNANGYQFNWASTADSAKPHTGLAGGGQAHNNLQPYIVTKFIIKVSDTTPVSAQIVDSYSASTTDGYSANFVNSQLDVISRSVSFGSVNAGADKFDQTTTVSIPSGYEAIGIVGYSLTGGYYSWINVARLYISGTTVYWSISNPSSHNTGDINCDVKILVRKTNQSS